MSPYCDKQLLSALSGPEMASKASSFYPLPSPFWTLQTGQAKPGQAEIEKFRFSPLTYTHTKTGIIRLYSPSTFWILGRRLDLTKNTVPRATPATP